MPPKLALVLVLVALGCLGVVTATRGPDGGASPTSTGVESGSKTIVITGELRGPCVDAAPNEICVTLGE